MPDLIQKSIKRDLKLMLFICMKIGSIMVLKKLFKFKKKMNIKRLENKIFSKKSRYDLNKNQFLELNQNFKNANLFIIGAAGSIGKAFTLKLNAFKFKKLILLDNNESSLADLSRDINLIFNKNKPN